MCVSSNVIFEISEVQWSAGPDTLPLLISLNLTFGTLIDGDRVVKPGLFEARLRSSRAVLANTTFMQVCISDISVLGGGCNVTVDTVSPFVLHLVYKSLVLERYRLTLPCLLYHSLYSTLYL
jgi:hypothetical protein